MNLPNSELELREIGEDWNSEWDSLASANVACGVMQSSLWAAFKRLEGYETVRYGLFLSGRLLGGALIYFYPYAGREGFLICPEGPVLPWDDRTLSLQCLRLLQNEARNLSETRGGIGFRIEPHLPPPAPSLLRNWKRAPIDLTPVHTLILDLDQSVEDILTQMRPKGRYNLKLAQKHGVTIRRSTEMKDVPEFYRLFTETARRNDFFAEPYGFFLNLCSIFFPTASGELYLADWEGECLGAILVVTYGMRATYLYGGSTNSHREVMPNYLIQWEAIKMAKERGCLEYDFFGYDPFGLTDHLYSGISRFKKQFGGRRMDSMGARDLVFYDRLADQVEKELSKE